MRWTQEDFARSGATRGRLLGQSEGIQSRVLRKPSQVYGCSLSGFSFGSAAAISSQEGARQMSKVPRAWRTTMVLPSAEYAALKLNEWSISPGKVSMGRPLSTSQSIME